MKTKCLVCEKNKIMDYKQSQGQDICKQCLKISPKLKTEIIKLNETYQHEANTPEEFRFQTQQQESARDNLSSAINIASDISLEDRSEVLSQTIINKVEELYLIEKKQKMPSEVKVELQKTLGDFNSFNLEECAESVESATSFDEIRSKGMIRSIKRDLDIPNPKDLYEEIAEGVIDQDHAVRTIASAIVKHYCRVKDSSIKKQNIFILGPTGTGKTELVRTLAKKVDIPLVTIDATALTATGYKGNTASELIVTSVLKAARNNQELAKYAIVFIDEIDKKAAPADQLNTEINGTAVQDELLKIIEGGIIHTGNVELDTSNILFIVAGAFSGLEKIINQKMVKKMGLNSDEPKGNLVEDFMSIDNEHLIRFGLKPEFIGRFSVVTYTKPLTKDTLLKILKKKDGLITHYQKVFAQFKCELNFSNEFLEEVVNEAMTQRIGARGLERILERKMDEHFFNVYSFIGESIVITAGGKISKRRRLEVSKKEQILF